MSKAGINRNLPNDAYEAATNANNPSASNPFITEVESAVGSASLILYPTSAASAVPTYNKLVNAITDPDYDNPAVDSSTGAITGTSQLIGTFASEEGVIEGNPGVVNINTIGNIRRISGSGTATFYFEIYHRNNLGTETLIGTSNTTGASSNAVYEQYFASCLINAIAFVSTDRVVTKWYANRIAGGSDPVYEIQLGGVTPVKITFPVPFVNLPSAVEELNDLTDVTTGLPGSPTNADDGRVLYYDVNTSQWISDDIANISNVVKDCKTSVSTGSIAKGVPVYLAGFDNDLLVVEACDAASASTMPCIGITAEALDSTNAKKVISFGKLQGVNTAAFTEGDILYVAAGGGFTTTRPTGTSLIQRIAVVLKADNPGGILKVINTSRTAGLPNLANGNTWVGDASGYPVETALPPAGHVVYDAPTSTPLTQRTKLVFSGAGVTAVDSNDITYGNHTLVTIPGGGGGGSWNPPQTTLEDWSRGNTAPLTTAGASNDTYYFFTDSTGGPGGVANPLITTKLHLGQVNGLDYDASNLQLRIHTQLFGTNANPGDNVRWEIEYLFLGDGEDGANKASTIVTIDVDYTGRTLANGLYTDILGTITGQTNAKELRIFLRRVNTVAADTYANDVDFFGIDIIKV